MSRVILVIIVAALGCVCCNSPESKPIDYGKAQCAACRMGIADSKFGAELVTTTGKIRVFDSPECLIEHYMSGAIDTTQVHSLWVTDFINPGTLINARTAWYLQSDMIKSPMGLNVAAFTDEQSAERARVNYVGKIIRFDDVVALVMR